jgi:hypothetical protein
MSITPALERMARAYCVALGENPGVCRPVETLNDRGERTVTMGPPAWHKHVPLMRRLLAAAEGR